MGETEQGNEGAGLPGPLRLLLDKFDSMPAWVRVLTYLTVLALVVYLYISPRFVSGQVVAKTESGGLIPYRGTSLQTFISGHVIKLTADEDGHWTLPVIARVPGAIELQVYHQDEHAWFPVQIPALDVWKAEVLEREVRVVIASEPASVELELAGNDSRAAVRAWLLAFAGSFSPEAASAGRLELSADVKRIAIDPVLLKRKSLALPSRGATKPLLGNARSLPETAEAPPQAEEPSPETAEAAPEAAAPLPKVAGEMREAAEALAECAEQLQENAGAVIGSEREAAGESGDSPAAPAPPDDGDRAYADVLGSVTQAVDAVSGTPARQPDPARAFSGKGGLPYVDRIQVIIRLEKAYDLRIPDEHWTNIDTTGELSDYIIGRKQLEEQYPKLKKVDSPNLWPAIQQELPPKSRPIFVSR